MVLGSPAMIPEERNGKAKLWGHSGNSMLVSESQIQPVLAISI